MSHSLVRLSFLLLSLPFLMGSCNTALKQTVQSQDRQIVNLQTENRQLEKEIEELKAALKEKEEALAEAAEEEKTESVRAERTGSQMSMLRNRGNSKLNSYLNGSMEMSVGATASQMDKAIRVAESFKGTPHVMGGTSRSGIDCSGLLYVSLDEAGIDGMPRMANDMARYGTVIAERGDLRRGDLVFFTNTYSTSKFITHAGIYLGSGEFIHTSSSKGVSVGNLTRGYWGDKYVFGTRIVE